MSRRRLRPTEACTLLDQRGRGAGVVERDGLENRCALTRTVGSNPTPSAIIYERNRKQNSLTMKKCVEFRVVLDLKMSRP